MQQDAGLTLKCLGGRLACGRWPISLVYRATEGSCYWAACATSSCFPGGAKRSPGEAATSAGGRRIAPSPNGPKEQPQPRRQPHTPTSTIYTHPHVFNNNASPCNTIDFTRYY